MIDLLLTQGLYSHGGQSFDLFQAMQRAQLCMIDMQQPHLIPKTAYASTWLGPRVSNV
ncbi:hypothetical protein BH10CHL1_BH10CHL1_12940 [soil metagenome]